VDLKRRFGNTVSGINEGKELNVHPDKGNTLKKFKSQDKPRRFKASK